MNKVALQLLLWRNRRRVVTTLVSRKTQQGPHHHFHQLLTQQRAMTTSYSWDEVKRRNGTNGEFWVVVDSYVLDLTKFLDHHPGSARKIINRRNKSVDITSNFVDHFGHTVRTFREACRDYDSTRRPVVLKFRETESLPDADVVIVGKIEDDSSS